MAVDTMGSPRYTLLAELGSGAFAKVFRCVSEAHAEDVAAKVVSRKGRWKMIGGRSVRCQREYETFLGERAALCQLGRHPRVVGVEGFIEEADRALLLLELAPGGDLEAYMVAHPDGVSEGTAHGFASDLFAALAHCHTYGVVHRDVKLANLLLAADGTLRLADFGHAATWMIGTKPYCAPEIISCGKEGYAGPPVDMWSAGVCLFALLSGRLPFAVADRQADWRFEHVQASQAIGGSACVALHNLAAADAAGDITASVASAEPATTNSNGATAASGASASSASAAASNCDWQRTPWREAVVRLVDVLLHIDPTRRATAAGAMRAGWLVFYALTRSSASLAPVDSAGNLSSALVSPPMMRPGAAGGASSTALSHRSASLSFLRQPSGGTARDDAAAAPIAAAAASAAAPVAESVSAAGATAAMDTSGDSGNGGGANASLSQCTSDHERDASPGLPGLRRSKRQKHADEAAQFDRTCVWRGLQVTSRVEMQDSAERSHPSTSLRYSVMQATGDMAAADSEERRLQWLREDRAQLPLIEAHRPFKPKLANNNNYTWGASGAANTPQGRTVLPTPRFSEHPSRRMCPFGR